MGSPTVCRAAHVGLAVSVTGHFAARCRVLPHGRVTRGPGSDTPENVPASDAHLPKAASGPPDVGSPARRCVLIVEDSEDVRELLAECVRSLGHEVHVAADGIEGIASFTSVSPDIALLDVGLPGIDGYELARRIREQPGGAGVHLVALTGYGGVEVKRQAERSGFNLQLTKPIDMQGLTGLFASYEAARG